MATVPSGTSADTWHRDLFAAVAGWEWLARLTDRLTAVVHPRYERHRDALVVEALHGGRWVGHALHPALSDVPIGLWGAAVVLETAGHDGVAPGRRLDPVATLSAAGLAGALATAATGVADWSVSDGEDRRVGAFHGLLNAAATVLQGAALVTRLAGHRRPARGLSAASFALTAGAGFVGGHLVQGRGAMVNRVAGASGPTRWVPALAAAELPDGATVGVEVEGRRVLLLRRGADVHAVDDVCSHAGGRLSRGEVTGSVVTCPLHGARFDVRDGRVVRGPAHHPQPVLPTRIRKDWIEVRGALPRTRRTST